MFNVGSVADTTLDEHIRKQIDTYNDQYKIDENVFQWALIEIRYSNCSDFQRITNNSEQLDDLAAVNEFNCDEISSANFDKNNLWNEFNKSRYEEIKNVLQQNDLSQVSIYREAPHLYLELLMSSSYTDYLSSEMISNSLETWEKELSNLSQKENPLQYSIITSIIIWSSFIVDDYVRLKKYIDGFVESEYFPFSKKRLKIYGAFDFTFYTFGEFDRSLNLLQNYSLPLAKYLKDTYQAYRIKIRQGVYLYRLGKYQESKNIYEELYEESGISDYFVFTNLGVNYYKLGYSNKYISFQLKALEHQFADYKNLLSVYRNLFLFYAANKDINSALLYIDKAKEVALDNQDTTELALIDSYLGVFFWTQYKDHKKALANFNTAQKNLSPDDNFSKYVELLYEKGNIYYRLDSLDKAQQHFERGRELALSKSNNVEYITSLIYLAAIELKRNNVVAAENILDEMDLYSLDELDFELLTQHFTVKSNFLHLQGNHREAIALLNPVVEQVISRAKNNTDSQEGYWSVEEEYLDAIELLVSLHIENDNSTAALTLLDQLKTINDASLYNSPLVKASKLSEEDLAEEKRLNQRLQTLRKKYLNADESLRFELKQEIDRVSALREQILSKVNLDKSTPLSPIWAIQRSIAENELVLHFTELGSNLYISGLSKHEVQIKKLDFSQQKQQKFNEIADALASGNTNLQALHELYQELELHTIPDDIQQITVIPDNFLYRIPLEVLPAKAPDSPVSFGSTRYLIEDYQFRYFTSLKEFETNRRNISTNNQSTYDFSGFAISDFSGFEDISLPSLPYATVETKNIYSSLSTLDEKNIFTENDATKESFKKRVGNSRLVHVATHSEVSEQDPLFSTIYLRTDSPSDTSLQSDQALYAYELFDTPLNSELIMLNSCSSGSGNYIQGSGIMGISRALRYAGAKSLALNLWAVNDKIASEFATDFYTYLNEGDPKNQAIRKAKLNQLKTGNANPHFWGAYTMIGNPSPITNKSPQKNLFLGFLALGTIMIGFFTYSQRDK